MLKPLIPSHVRMLRNVRYRRGGSWRLALPDRDVLENEIPPHFSAQPGMRKILDVGSIGYHEIFPEAEHRTIERHPELARYGAPHHRSISLLEAEDFEEGAFDLVLCNGVFGWGIDDPEETGAAVAVIARLLRPGGIAVLGWDDNDSNRPSRLAEAADGLLRPYSFPPANATEIRTETRWNHVFSFCTKAA